jgi:hypothetical protein
VKTTIPRDQKKELKLVYNVQRKQSNINANVLAQAGEQAGKSPPHRQASSRMMLL